jgi:hypothetical protein
MNRALILMTAPDLIIQMLETRQAGKTFSRPFRRKTSCSNHATPSRSFAKAALITAVQARDGETFWTREKSKLNL